MLERGVSCVGMLVLLGIAYLFSRDRRAVSLRTVAWGVALQILLAVILLARQDVYSFLGLFVLLFLIVLYLCEAELSAWSIGPWGVGAVALVASAALVALGTRLATSGVTAVAFGLAVALAVAAGVWRARRVTRFAVAAALLLGLALLWARGTTGQVVFRAMADRVADFLALSNLGAEFLFGNLAKETYFFTGEGATWPGFGFQFAFAVLPTIIFFSAFMSILYHLGVIQVVIAAMARFMRWTMRTSGAETVSCSANVFVGQTEAPFLVKPFLGTMTVSELHAVMVGGFATVAGGVLAAYIRLGIDAGHLIAASVMSAPAALVMAKILFPETEASVTSGEIEMPDLRTADNLVGAATNGVTDGLKLALNVGAMLIAFISLIGLVDAVLGWGDYWIDGRWLGGVAADAQGPFPGIFPDRLATLFGTLLAPLAYVMGVPWQDAGAVGNLLGIKVSVNEFVAYGILGEHVHAGDLSPRSMVIATYALCGFANFASIGIQIGGIGAIAPQRRSELARIGVRAMFGGALASWMTATIAGILV